MTPQRSRLVTLVVVVMGLPMAGVAPAQTPEATPRVYRCGDSYGTTPCPGGKPVVVEDSRSDDQRRQAQAVKTQDAQLARELAAERRARERAAAGQRAARLGPSETERAKAERDAKKKKKPKLAPRTAKTA